MKTTNVRFNAAFLGWVQLTGFLNGMKTFHSSFAPSAQQMGTTDRIFERDENHTLLFFLFSFYFGYN